MLLDRDAIHKTVDELWWTDTEAVREVRACEGLCIVQRAAQRWTHTDTMRGR